MRIEGIIPRNTEEKIKDSTPGLRSTTEELKCPFFSSDSPVTEEELATTFRNFLKARSNPTAFEFQLGKAYDEQEIRDLKFPGVGTLSSMSKTQQAKIMAAIVTQVPNFVRLEMAVRKLEDQSTRTTIRVWNSPSGELFDEAKAFITYWTDTWV